jgi:hypothetical protein
MAKIIINNENKKNKKIIIRCIFKKNEVRIHINLKQH